MKSLLNKGTPRVGEGKEETKRKSSILFIQLGLVLALMLVYVAIESTTNTSSDSTAYNTTLIMEELETPPEIIIEKPIIEQPKAKPEPKIELVELKIVDDTQEEDDAPYKTSEQGEDEPVILDHTKLEEVEILEPVIEDVPFIAIEDAPIFPGCKGTKAEIKKCFSSSVNNLVSKKFNADLAQELGLPAGRQRISVQFTVDATGSISDVKVRAPHKRLEKETRRVVGLLPKMTPGKQRKKPVGVKFNLPIIFEVIE